MELLEMMIFQKWQKLNNVIRMINTNNNEPIPTISWFAVAPIVGDGVCNDVGDNSLVPSPLFKSVIIY